MDSRESAMREVKSLENPRDTEFIVTLRQVHQQRQDVTRRFTLDKNRKTMKIGRASKVSSKGLVAAANNAWFDSPVMSRDHAELSVNYDKTPAYVTIKDTGSLHGTFHLPVNGLPHQRVHVKPERPELLQDGDSMWFGIDIFRSHTTFPPCEVAVGLEERHRDLPQVPDEPERGPVVNHFVVPIDDDDDDDVEEEEQWEEDADAEEAVDGQSVSTRTIHIDLTDDVPCSSNPGRRYIECPQPIDLTIFDESLNMKQPSPTLEAQEADLGASDLRGDDLLRVVYSSEDLESADSALESDSDEGLVPRSILGSDDDESELEFSDDYHQDTDVDQSDFDDEDMNWPQNAKTMAAGTADRADTQYEYEKHDSPSEDEESPAQDIPSPYDLPETPSPAGLAPTHVALKDLEPPSTHSGMRIVSLLQEHDSSSAAEPQELSFPEKIGKKTGKLDYFMAREQNRDLVLHQNYKEHQSPAVESVESALRETLVAKPPRAKNTVPQEITLHPPTTAEKSAWESSGDDFINKPSPEAEDRVTTENRTRLQSPGFDMTSAFSFGQSKNDLDLARSHQTQTSRRLDIQSLLSPSQKSVETQDSTVQISAPVSVPVPSTVKRSFDEAFESEDPEPSIHELEDPETATQEVETPIVSVVAVERNPKPTKRRRIAEVAACVALGGASVLSALIMTAPTFS